MLKKWRPGAHVVCTRRSDTRHLGPCCTSLKRRWLVIPPCKLWRLISCLHRFLTIWILLSENLCCQNHRAFWHTCRVFVKKSVVARLMELRLALSLRDDHAPHFSCDFLLHCFRPCSSRRSRCPIEQQMLQSFSSWHLCNDFLSPSATWILRVCYLQLQAAWS